MRTRTVLAIWSLVAMISLATIGCDRGGASPDKGQLTPPATPSPNPSPSPSPAQDLCQKYGSTPGQIKAGLIQEIQASGLGNQYGKGSFKVDVKKEQGTAKNIMMLDGKMGHLMILVDMVKTSVKPGCIDKVYFDRKGTIAIAGDPNIDDFYWYGCDPGFEPCDGNCVQVGSCHFQ